MDFLKESTNKCNYFFFRKLKNVMCLLPQCLETGLVATDGYKCTLHGGNQLDLKVCPPHSGSTAREQAE